MGYALTSGTSYCVADGHLVFLNVEQDRYFGLSPSAQKAFCAWRNIPDPEIAMPACLLARNLVRPAQATILAPCAVPRNIDEDYRASGSRSVSWWQAARLSLGVAEAKQRLFRNGLAPSLRTLLQAKTAVDLEEPDHAIGVRAGRAMEMVERLWSGKDQCLPKALALAHHLIRLHQRPTLVIGVTTRPFRAHSWVQVGTTLVSDTQEAVGDFTPILTL